MGNDKLRSTRTRWGVLYALKEDLRLAWALLKDPRVPTWVKVLVPGLALGYILSPVDFLPDIVPFLGEIDDVMVFLLLLRLFISLSPEYVVQEVEARLRGVSPPSPDVIEGRYRVVDEK